MTTRETGLPAERTAMAWQRTALGVGGVSALIVHHAAGTPWLVVPGVLGLLAALVLLVVVEERYHHTLHKVSAGETPMGPRLVRWTAVGTVALALAATVVVIVGPPGP